MPTAARVTVIAFLVAAATLTLAGCSEQLGDRPMGDDVAVTDLEAVQVFRNINGFPNIARACADGVAFAVTSTETGPGIVRVPEWDDQCPSTSG